MAKRGVKSPDDLIKIQVEKERCLARDLQFKKIEYFRMMKRAFNLLDSGIGLCRRQWPGYTEAEWLVYSRSLRDSILTMYPGMVSLGYPSDVMEKEMNSLMTKIFPGFEIGHKFGEIVNSVIEKVEHKRELKADVVNASLMNREVVVSQIEVSYPSVLDVIVSLAVPEFVVEVHLDVDETDSAKLEVLLDFEVQTGILDVHPDKLDLISGSLSKKVAEVNDKLLCFLSDDLFILGLDCGIESRCAAYIQDYMDKLGWDVFRKFNFIGDGQRFNWKSFNHERYIMTCRDFHNYNFHKYRARVKIKVDYVKPYYDIDRVFSNFDLRNKIILMIGRWNTLRLVSKLWLNYVMIHVDFKFIPNYYFVDAVANYGETPDLMNLEKWDDDEITGDRCIIQFKELPVKFIVESSFKSICVGECLCQDYRISPILFTRIHPSRFAFEAFDLKFYHSYELLPIAIHIDVSEHLDCSSYSFYYSFFNRVVLSMLMIEEHLNYGDALLYLSARFANRPVYTVEQVVQASFYEVSISKEAVYRALSMFSDFSQFCAYARKIRD